MQGNTALPAAQAGEGCINQPFCDAQAGGGSHQRPFFSRATS